MHIHLSSRWRQIVADHVEAAALVGSYEIVAWKQATPCFHRPPVFGSRARRRPQDFHEEKQDTQGAIVNSSLGEQIYHLLIRFTISEMDPPPVIPDSTRQKSFVA